ncbi:STAS domain-containing protein [Nocardia sp. NPDC056611]|uniref:STAS domain-containing protein n=1 Tax=Nocardia sp. NPDC056611 TaxID=3345877 RepID=UPI00366C5F44
MRDSAGESNHRGALLHITRSRPSPSIVILSVTGEVDATTIDELREHLSDAVAATGRLVVVDLSGVTFLSVSGIEALIDADDHARAHYRALCVVVGPRCVNRMLEVCGPNHLITVDTIDDARGPNPWVSALDPHLHTRHPDADR